MPEGSTVRANLCEESVGPRKKCGKRGEQRGLRLYVTRMEDFPFGYARRVVGQTSKLSWTEFMAMLFEANEHLAPSKRLTDREIENLILREFPDCRSSKRLLARKIGVSYYRSHYNAGKFTKGKRPKIQSFQYIQNSHGCFQVAAKRGRPSHVENRIIGERLGPGRTFERISKLGDSKLGDSKLGDSSLGETAFGGLAFSEKKEGDHAG